MRETLVCIIACVIIGLCFLTATEVNALIGFDGQCLDDCYNEGNTKKFCMDKCVAKPDPSETDSKPKFHSECFIACKNQGNTHDFCKGLCTY
jgi:hypothetical protein